MFRPPRVAMFRLVSPRVRQDLYFVVRKICSLAPMYVCTYTCTCVRVKLAFARALSLLPFFSLVVSGLKVSRVSLVCMYEYCAREILIGPWRLSQENRSFALDSPTYPVSMVGRVPLNDTMPGRMKRRFLSSFLAIDLRKDVCIKLNSIKK